VLIALGFVQNFWLAVVLVALWGIASAIDDPVHRAYLNDMIPSKQRATVLSFDSLMGSAGGVAFQPVLGRVADVGGYGASLLWSGVISAVAVPLVLMSRAQRDPADTKRDVSGGAAAEDQAATTADD
jgi:MFS family permease